MKIRVAGDWRGKGFIKSMPPEKQESGQKLVLPEKAIYIYREYHADEEVELCAGWRLGKVHSLYIDKEAWLREELRGGS